LIDDVPRFLHVIRYVIHVSRNIITILGGISTSFRGKYFVESSSARSRGSMQPLYDNLTDYACEIVGLDVICYLRISLRMANGELSFVP
jgi:hypothetical protein